MDAGSWGLWTRIRSGPPQASFLHKVTLAANTATRVVFTVPGPTTGTWTSDTSVGLTFIACLGTGTTFATPNMDVWQSGNFLGPTTQVNTVGNAASTFVISDVQVEVGTVATPFERRAYGQELSLCQRYYETDYSYGTAPADGIGTNLYSVAALNSTNCYGQNIPFKVTKRSLPALTFYSSLLVTAPTPSRWGYYNGTSWVNSTGDTVSSISSAESFAVSVYGVGFAPFGNYTACGFWAADAEF